MATTTTVARTASDLEAAVQAAAAQGEGEEVILDACMANVIWAAAAFGADVGHRVATRVRRPRIGEVSTGTP